MNTRNINPLMTDLQNHIRGLISSSYNIRNFKKTFYI